MAYADKFCPSKPFHERCGWNQEVKYAPGSWAAEEDALLRKMGQKRNPPGILTAPSWFDHAEALESILLAPDSVMTSLKRSLSFNEQLDELITYYPTLLPKDMQDNLKSLKASISRAGSIKYSHQHNGQSRIDSTTAEAIQSAAMLTAYCYVAENVMPIIIGEKLKDRDSSHQGYPYPDYGRIIKTCMYPILTKKSVREQCMQPVLERMQSLPLPDSKMRALRSLIDAFPASRNMHDVSVFVDREIMPEIRGQYSLQLNGERAHPLIADHREGGKS